MRYNGNSNKCCYFNFKICSESPALTVTVKNSSTPRAHPAHHPLSIIFLTGYSDDETLRRAKEVHPEGYIQKLFNDTDFRVALTLARDDSSPSLRTTSCHYSF